MTPAKRKNAERRTNLLASSGPASLSPSPARMQRSVEFFARHGSASLTAGWRFDSAVHTAARRTGIIGADVLSGSDKGGRCKNVAALICPKLLDDLMK
jgi:hypothetical protein